MVSSRSFGSALLALATLACASACGDDDGTVGNDDAGTADAGMVEVDSGMRADAGSDAGQDAGPSCTEGCAYVELALGSQHSCARRENGEVRCWGRGQEGQLGDGLEAHGGRCPQGGALMLFDCSPRPVAVALHESAKAFSAGLRSACAVDASGAVRCWGEVGYRLGTLPAESARYSPQQYPMLDDSAYVAEGTYLICSLERDATVRCAGRTSSRQTGTGGSSTDELEPTPVIRQVDETIEALSGIVEIALGTFANYACARSEDTLYCWGSGEAGQLARPPADLATNCGNDLTRNRCSGTALPISGLDAAEVTQLALGGEHVCALMSDGTVQCWGSNRAGQLGTDDADQRFEPAPVPGIGTAIQITAGANHTCALLSDGTVRCWGFNHQGQLGDGQESHGLTSTCTLGETETGDCWSTPATVVGLGGVTAIDAGTHHTCAIHDEGAAISCWGANEMLQVGGVSTNNPSGADLAARYAPTAVLGL